MSVLRISGGDTLTIAINLPAGRMDYVEDAVVTVRHTVFSISESTLAPTAQANVFLLKLSSQFTAPMAGGTFRVGVAVDYNDLGVVHLAHDKELIIRVGDTASSYYNESISDTIRATISLTIPEGVLEATHELINIVKGASAYDIALSNGFVGTEQEWLDSLVGGGGGGLSEQDVLSLIDADSAAEVKTYSAQFQKTGTLSNIQHWGSFEQRSINLLDLLSNADKTLSNDDASGQSVWSITAQQSGNYFTFPNFGDRRLNINIRLSITCSSPPFDKGAVIHLSRGANGTIVDDRSVSTIFQNFSSVNPGQINFALYTLAQGAADPYYLSPGGFGLVLENVTSSNAYNITKIKLDCVAIVQQG